jgi:predicted GNAT superfamily acetyltransferase
MMAVAAKHRNCGLGFRMKLFHRKLALEQGIKYICWTFDPLQSRNAALNISRLGGRVEEYLPDCYGRFPSRIERGLPSDRVVVNWRISSSQVARRLKYGPPRLANVTLPHVNATHRNNRGFLENQRMDLNLDAFRLLVEIPPDTDAMRAHALPLARRWRLESRTIFTNYFQAGYAVRDFFPPSAVTGGRCFYLLDREGKAPLELDADCK